VQVRWFRGLFAGLFVCKSSLFGFMLGCSKFLAAWPSSRSSAHFAGGMVQGSSRVGGVTAVSALLQGFIQPNAVLATAVCPQYNVSFLNVWYVWLQGGVAQE
jgi:hypothetical protein